MSLLLPGNLRPTRGTPVPGDGSGEEAYRCLVRASDGARKLATAVSARQLPRFLASFNLIQRAHTDGLKAKKKK